MRKHRVRDPHKLASIVLTDFYKEYRNVKSS